LCEQRRTGLEGFDREQNGGAFAWFWWGGQKGDVAVWMEAVDDLGTWRQAGGKALRADGNAAVGTDLDEGALAPNVGPPRTSRSGAKHVAALLAREVGGGIGSELQFAVDFLGIAVEAKLVKQCIGLLRRHDVFGGKDAGEAALPVEVLALDLPLGLWSPGIAEADTVEVEGGPQLGERVWALREEDAMAVDVEFEGQAVLQKGRRQEVEVGEQVLAVEDPGARAEAGAVVEQIKERILATMVMLEPGVRRGVQLPESAHLEALPATGRRGGPRGGTLVSQAVSECPASDGGWIELEVETAEDLGGDEAVRRRWTDPEEFAHERLDLRRPLRAAVAPGRTRNPVSFAVEGAGSEVIGIQFVESGAPQLQLFGSSSGAEFSAPESTQDLADQRGAQAVGKLAIVFFIPGRLPETGGGGGPPPRDFIALG
jgi:hypothetical protein